MSKSDDAGSAAASNIRHAYERCLEARRQWLAVRNRTAQDVPREAAHSYLHESVLGWFEALVPYIAERPGEVKQLWESAPLYPESELTERLWTCPNGHAFERPHDDLSGGAPCPECSLPVEPVERAQTNEDGRQLFEWACGLKRLSAWQNKTKKTRVTNDGWSADEKVVEQPQRLEPTVLMRAARYLDLAAEECGLLESTDRALATGEL